MKPISRQILIPLICLPLGLGLLYFVLPRHGEVVYNCDIAEISPDFPIQAREQCRKLRAERNNK